MAAGRIPAIDLARAGALLAMAVFHVGRDLDVMGVTAPGSSFTPAWQWSARLIAGSFVFLAGVSLWLGHGRGLRRGPFLRRLGMLLAAAALVSLATWATFPAQWVRFGILHSIALSSVIGLAFLRVPAWGCVGAGAAMVWIGSTVAVDLPTVLQVVIGLGRDVPAMMDWEPVFPWTGPFLLGLGVAKAMDPAGWWDRLRGRPAGPGWDRLGWPGRHSLAVYLVHQPMIVGTILAWQRLAS